MKTRTSDPAALHVPSKWLRHYRQLQTLREALMADRADQIAEVAEPLEPHSMDDADSATDEFDHNLALGILSHEEDALFEVDAAIRRILDGSYGICEMTGGPIPDARLQVVPWTRYTKEALERIERRGGGDRTHLAAVSSLQGPAPGGLPYAPEPEEPISQETSRRQRREQARELSGDAGLTITSIPTFES